MSLKPSLVTFIAFIVAFGGSYLSFQAIVSAKEPPAPKVLSAETQSHSPTPSPSPEPTETPVQTPSPSPTLTSTPTQTPAAISTPSPIPTLSPTPTQTPTPTATPTSTPEPLPTATPDVWSPPDLEPLFTQYANVYNVDKNILERIVVCESHFNPLAVSGDYVGLFQFSTNTWVNYRTQMGTDTNPSLRTSAEESIRTGAFVISQRGISPWPSCL